MASLAVFVYRDLYPRTNSESVCFRTLQFQRNPVVACILSGIHIKSAMKSIAFIRAAHFNINILIAVVIDIRKRDSVPFLQMTNPRLSSNIEKFLSFLIIE